MVHRVRCHVVRGSMKMPRIRRWKNGDVRSSRATEMSLPTITLLFLDFLLDLFLFLCLLGSAHLLEIHRAFHAGLECLHERVAKQSADHAENTGARLVDGAMQRDGGRHLMFF